MGRKSKSQSDNRMQWILAIEEVKQAKKKDAYFTDYEICSEVRIPGVLNYGNGALMCSLFQEADSNGLYTYIVRVKHVFKEYKFDESKYSKEGYYFKDGLIGELLAIFSIYFQARFFLKATISGELTPKSVRMRHENKFRYVRTHPCRNYEMFTTDKERNWAHKDGLKIFLDHIKGIAQSYHQGLMRAFFWYLEAVKEIGVDSQLYFIKMVSAIEALLQFLPKNTDKFEHKLLKVVKGNSFDTDEIQEVCNWLINRKIGHRFATFFKTYSIGFVKGGKRKAKHCYIPKKDADDYIRRIYNSRSAYLHTGKPMYLSEDMVMDSARKWDLDGSSGMMADRKKFDDKEKLPRMRWFERISNYSMKKFLGSIQNEK